MNKNIFFFWEGIDIPGPLLRNIKQTEAIHPDHSIRIVNSNDVLPLLESTHIGLAKIYNDIKIPAVKSDIARLVLLNEFGGWYLDCDMSLRVSVNYYESVPANLHLFWRIDNKKFIIQNSIMGGKAKNPFFNRALTIISRLLLNKVNNYSVYKTSGPMALAPAASEYMGNSEASIIEMDYTKCDVIDDGITKGSWTYQENCGILLNKENPPVFNPNSSVDRIGSEKALRYYIEVFDQFPSTKNENYRKLLKRLAIHYLKTEHLREEVRELVEKYMVSSNDKKFLLDFYQEYNN